MVKKISSIIAIVLVVVIVIMTIYKINKNHEEKLYNVLYSEIKYAAKKCYLEENCEKNIKLKDLYEKKYLDVKYDPITKEELNKDINIIITEKEVKITKEK